MTIEQYIKESAPALGHRILIAPDIPGKKLNGCTSYVSSNIPGEYILIFGDATLLGKGTMGFAFSGDTLYFANDKGEKQFVLLKDIEAATYMPKKTHRSDAMFEMGDKVIINTRKGNYFYLETCLIGFNCDAMTKILNGVAQKVNSGEVPLCTRQNVTLSEMPEKIKLAYLKMLCNYAYLGDGVINSEEYSAIQSIIVRIELKAEGRGILREYMSDIEQREKSGNLLYIMGHELESGSYDILRYSLLQDVLYLHKIANNGKPWNEDGFIGSLLNNLKVSPMQLELMESAVDLHREITSNDANIYELQDKSKALVKESLKLHVPLMTLYCSGSPYNVDTYNKLFRKSDRAQVAIDKQRELMLQAVVQNTQKTLNHLVEEMNSVSEQLIKEIQRGSVASQKIEKLSALLGRLSAGATRTVEKSQGTEEKILYSQLPRELDMNLFQKLYKGEVNKAQCEYVFSLYPQGEGSLGRIIKKNLSVETLSKLLRTMEEISYPLKGDDEDEKKSH